MKTPIIIREKVFKFKKDALQYFKTKLNSYEFEEVLNDEDTADVIALLLENGTRKEKLVVE